MNKIILGDCKEVLKGLGMDSVHAIITDPPYELGSFRKEIGKWEKESVCESNVFSDCNRILKSGGHIACFSSNRTMYKFGNAIERDGFELRDTLLWRYPQSMPRNMDVAKAVDAQITYGKTSSKYMRMIEQEYGGDSYTISGTQNTMFGDKVEFQRKEYSPITPEGKKYDGWGTNLAPSYEPIILARKVFKGSLASNVIKNGLGGLNINEGKTMLGKYPSNILDFPKAKKDVFNNHPTVKPTNLLEYLILLLTNEGDTVLDPFMGSGSTMIACINTGRNYIGIESNEEYYKIAEKRVSNSLCDKYVSDEDNLL